MFLNTSEILQNYYKIWYNVIFFFTISDVDVNQNRFLHVIKMEITLFLFQTFSFSVSTK